MGKEMFRGRREEMGKPRPGGGVSMFSKRADSIDTALTLATHKGKFERQRAKSRNTTQGVGCQQNRSHWLHKRTDTESQEAQKRKGCRWLSAMTKGKFLVTRKTCGRVS